MQGTNHEKPNNRGEENDVRQKVSTELLVWAILDPSLFSFKLKHLRDSYAFNLKVVKCHPIMKTYAEMSLAVLISFFTQSIINLIASSAHVSQQYLAQPLKLSMKNVI